MIDDVGDSQAGCSAAFICYIQVNHSKLFIGRRTYEGIIASLLSHAVHIPFRCPAFLAHHCTGWASVCQYIYNVPIFPLAPAAAQPSPVQRITCIHLSSLVVPICDYTFRSSVCRSISCCHVNVTSFLCFLFCPCARMFVVDWLSPQPGSVDPDFHSARSFNFKINFQTRKLGEKCSIRHHLLHRYLLQYIFTCKRIV